MNARTAKGRSPWFSLGDEVEIKWVDIYGHYWRLAKVVSDDAGGLLVRYSDDGTTQPEYKTERTVRLARDPSVPYKYRDIIAVQWDGWRESKLPNSIDCVEPALNASWEIATVISDDSDGLRVFYHGNPQAVAAVPKGARIRNVETR